MNIFFSFLFFYFATLKVEATNYERATSTLSRFNDLTQFSPNISSGAAVNPSTSPIPWNMVLNHFTKETGWSQYFQGRGAGEVTWLDLNRGPLTVHWKLVMLLLLIVGSKSSSETLKFSACYISFTNFLPSAELTQISSLT